MADVVELDVLLLSQVTDAWREVARVVGATLNSLPKRPSGMTRPTSQPKSLK